MKPQKRPFTVERGRLSPRTRTLSQYACEPDRIAQLRLLADSLQNIPREFVETKEDIFNFNRRVAGKIRVIADDITILEPITKKAVVPQIARPSERQVRRERRRWAANQLEMSL